MKKHSARALLDQIQEHDAGAARALFRRFRAVVLECDEDPDLDFREAPEYDEFVETLASVRAEAQRARAAEALRQMRAIRPVATRRAARARDPTEELRESMARGLSVQARSGEAWNNFSALGAQSVQAFSIQE